MTDASGKIEVGCAYFLDIGDCLHFASTQLTWCCHIHSTNQHLQHNRKWGHMKQLLNTLPKVGALYNFVT